MPDPAEPAGALRERASALHAGSLVWDDHSGFEPVPAADLDQLERWRAAGVDYLSVNVGYDVITPAQTLQTLADFRVRLARRPDRYLLVRTVDDILRAQHAGLLGITFDLEGMDALADDVNMVALFYALGVRQMLVAYNRNNRAGGGCHDADVGLTDFGRSVIAEMLRVGMVVDCSHTAYRTTIEAMEMCAAAGLPAIFSHSNPAALVRHGRNIRDEQIRACAATGGVIGLNGIGLFLADEAATTASIARAIDYVVELVGVAHAGIGLDYPFPVAGDEIDDLLVRRPDVWPPAEGYGTGRFRNADPEQFPGLTEELLRLGYADADVVAILGGNFLRVARACWK